MRMSRNYAVAFLVGHERYNTMNSWNKATSYSRCVKINRLTFPDNETRNRAYDLLQCEGTMDESGVNDVLRQFAEDHYWEWQIGFNGRSSGYLVLYQGGRKPSEYKSWCMRCGQGNFTEADAGGSKCGRCGSEKSRLNQTRYQVFTNPGKGLDMGEDFEEWEYQSIIQRVKLVKEFDAAVDEAVSAFIEYCKTHVAAEETIMVERQVIVAKEI